MATNWKQEQKEAYNDLLDDGALFTFVRKHKGKPDPVDGRMEEEFTETFKTPGILVTNHNRDYRFYGMSLDLFSREYNKPQGLRLQNTDTMLVAAMTYPNPLPEDRVEINGVVWVVVGSASVRTATVALLHYLTIKMG